MKAVIVIDMPNDMEIKDTKALHITLFNGLFTKDLNIECPLRPLPEKQKLTVTGKNQIEKKRIIKSKSLEQIKKGFINNSEVAFYCGYNACLDEITGETDEQ